MIVFLIFLFISQVSQFSQAEEQKVESKPLQFPDVTLHAEDTVYLTPPAAVRSEIILAPPENQERIQYYKASSAVKISMPDVRIMPNALMVPGANSIESARMEAGARGVETDAGIQATQPDSWVRSQGILSPLNGLIGEITYIPAHLLYSGLLIEQAMLEWNLFADFRLGIADGWLNPHRDSISHFQFGLVGERRLNPFFLTLHIKSGAFFLPEGSSVYLITAQKELSTRSQWIEIREKTAFTGQNGHSEESPEGVLEEEISLKSPGELIRGYCDFHGFLWGTASPGIEGYGLVGLGGIFSPVDLPLTLSAGGSILYYNREFRLYPEGELNLYIFPFLIFKIRAKPYLDLPENTEFYAVNSPGEVPLFQPQGGYSLKSGLLLDLPDKLNFSLFLEYIEGSLYQANNKLFMLVPDIKQFNISSEATWRFFNPSHAYLPVLTVQGLYTISLPIQEAFRSIILNTFMGIIKIDFINFPLEFIISVLWGDCPYYESDQLISEHWNLYSGLALCLKVVWTLNNQNSCTFGVELLNPEDQEKESIRFLLSYGIRRMRE